MAARRRRALVASPRGDLRREVAASLSARGFEVDTFERLDLAALPASRRPDLVVTDAPGWAAVLAASPRPALIFLVGPGAEAEGARALDAGAAGVLPVALAGGELLGALAGAAVAKAAPRRDEPDLVDAAFLGASAPVREARRLARAACTTAETVLILGEAGTGKKLLAETIARASRPRRPALVAALDLLAEDEHEGALFGARGEEGLLAYCAGGSLVLAEVHALARPARARLLDLLERASRGEGLDVRLLATSSADLPGLVAGGAFERALYYRLATVAIHVPPLRLRPADVPVLAAAFVSRASARLGKPIRRVGAEALRALRARPFPGNVGELEGLVERAVAIAPGLALLPKHLDEAERLGPPARAALRPEAGPGGLLRAVEVATRVRTADAVPALLAAPRDDEEAARTSDFFDLPYPEAKERMLLAFELDYVRHALSRAAGRVGEAARLAGIDRANFRRLAKRALERARR